jgi:nicotinamidase-related amidase
VIEVGGKTVLTELHEIAAPEHTALVVVDMQNDLCDERGAFAQQGAHLSAYGPAIERQRALIDAARESGVLIAFIRATTLPNDLSRSPAQILFELRMKESYARPLDEPFEFCMPGTWGHDVVEALGWRPGDFTVDKHRSSAFVGTNLDLVLRSNAIRTVVVTGCTTEGCVDSTVRDAGFLDYYPVVPRDCVASDNQHLHEAAMVILEAYRAVVTDGDALQRIWREGGGR